MQRNLRHIWGDMMHYRPLLIRHLGGRVRLSPAGFTPLSLYYGLPKYQINRLQHTQNALARAVVQAPKFQHITPILKYLHWLKVSERIEYKIISLTYIFSISLSHCICMTLYLFSLLTVTTHSLHLMLLWSNHHHHSKSLIDPSDMLHLISGTSFCTSLRIPHLNYSFPSKRPSFEHAGLTCYTLLSLSITFSLFHSELKTYFFKENLILHLSLFLSVGLISMALDRSPDLFAHRLYVLVLFFSVLVFPECGRSCRRALW